MSQISGSSPASNLAAELMLNRVQNGDVKLASGKTTNTASRLLSSALTNNANLAKMGRENMDYGYAIASATQDMATAGRNVVNEVAKLIDEMANSGDLGVRTALNEKAIKLIDNYQASANGATLNGEKLFGRAADVTLAAGLGGSSITLKATDAAAIDLDALKTTVDAAAASNSAANITAAKTAATTVSNLMAKTETIFATKAASLANQGALTESYGGLLDNAATNQFTSGTGGPENLLGNVLGTSA